MNDSVPTDPLPDAAELLRGHSEAVTDCLRRVLDRYGKAPPGLIEAIRYSLLGGGKRLRPALVLESARAAETASASSQQPPADAPCHPGAFAAAAAIELIHTFSLVHDDLPAMDDDDLRRGRPTSHKVFGEAMAILAGDAMVSMAFEVLAADAEDADIIRRLIGELAGATGPLGMIGGQVLDIQGEHAALSLAALQRMHRMKTGALLRAACRMGAIAGRADASQLAAITRYGEHLGLAFQIVDDLLDVTATAQQLGKAAGKDAAAGKNTYPALIGIEPSRQEARRQLTAAIEAIKGFGPAGAGLQSLARFVVEREF